jgi:hypothetical protein
MNGRTHDEMPPLHSWYSLNRGGTKTKTRMDTVAAPNREQQHKNSFEQ